MMSIRRRRRRWILVVVYLNGQYSGDGMICGETRHDNFGKRRLPRAAVGMKESIAFSLSMSLSLSLKLFRGEQNDG
jgi:hypothetical protein